MRRRSNKVGKDLRLFIAIQFTKNFKAGLLDLGQELRKTGLRGSYTAPDKLHLTLCFIGNVPSAQPVISALKAVEFNPFELELTELGVFRNLLWVGTKENEELRRLVKDLRSALNHSDINYDKKPFKSHITLVRKMEGAKPTIEVAKTKMRVVGFSLMNSSHVNGRLTYTELASFGLRALHFVNEAAGNKERQSIEALWASEKYFVLSKSQKIYNEIRAYLKKDKIKLSELRAKIEEAKGLEDKRGQVVNALQHIWGYFKKQAEPFEREEFMSLILRYERGETEKYEVLSYLEGLLKKYPNEYLQKSTIFSM